nr:tripartite tricarboxylate transporter permease [Halorussus halophilus]
MVEGLTQAIDIITSGQTPLWILLGVLLGIFFGALPGIGATLGMAIVLPLTLPLGGADAIILLISIYSGAMYGGSIPAILVNVPGTAGDAATTFEGYPLARKGRAIDALTVSALSSAIGGVLAVIALIAISPVMVELVLLFGSPQYFLMAILGLSMITVITQGSTVKGITAGAFGLLLATVGVAPSVPIQRYTFDRLALYDGLNYVAILIGLFAIAEMISLSEEEQVAQSETGLEGSVFSGIRKTITYWVTLLKSAFLGLVIGAVPGSGASISNFIAYGEAMRSSKTPEKFGNGTEEGIVATDSANNGTVAGSLIPTLSFGIPGSGSTAVLLGGLIMHGLRPGPDLFTSQIGITYSVFLALLFGNLIILFVGLIVVPRTGYLTQVDTDLIIPVIVVLSSLGALALRNNWVDVWTIIVLGMVGYFMKKYNYSIIAFVLGAILGPIAEENLYRSLSISGGSFSIFLTDPLSLVLVVLTIVILAGPYLKTKIAEIRAGTT